MGGELRAGEISPPTPAGPCTWQTCSPQARIVLETMRRCTPPGAAPPWRSSPNVAVIQAQLDDGVPLEDLVELVEGAALVVRTGRQSPRWCYPRNLFQGVSSERWLADIAQARRAQLAADERQAELAASEERDRLERAQAGAPKVQHFELHRLAEDLIAHLREREAPVVGSGHEAPPATDPHAAKARGVQRG